MAEIVASDKAKDFFYQIFPSYMHQDQMNNVIFCRYFYSKMEGFLNQNDKCNSEKYAKMQSIFDC